MDYSTYLPSYFTSWFDFYENAKPHFEEGVEGFYFQAPSQEAIFPQTTQSQAYKCSIQYIKNQVLEELNELRELQTFNFEELYYSYNALQVSERFGTDSGDVIRQSLQKKVGQLIINIRRKNLQGL